MEYSNLVQAKIKSSNENTGKYFSYSVGGAIYTKEQIDQMARNKEISTEKFIRIYGIIDVTDKVVTTK